MIIKSNDDILLVKSSTALKTPIVKKHYSPVSLSLSSSSGNDSSNSDNDDSDKVEISKSQRIKEV
jgi:hypothetical protein